MDMRLLKFAVSGKYGVSSWAALCYLGTHFQGTLDDTFAQLVTDLKASSAEQFVAHWESKAATDKARGDKSYIAAGVNHLVSSVGDEGLKWLPADVRAWIEQNQVVVRIAPVVTAPATSLDLAEVVKHPLIPNLVNLLVGVLCVALLGFIAEEILSGIGLPKLVAWLVVIFLGAYAIQWLVRWYKSKKAPESVEVAVPVHSGPSRRVWLYALSGAFLVVFVGGLLLWSTGEDVVPTSKNESPVIVMTLTPTPTLSANVIQEPPPVMEVTPTPVAELIVSRNNAEDPALRDVVNGFVADMYYCARSVELLKQVSPEGNLPSTYAQLLQTNISGVDSTLNDKWGNLVSAMSRAKMPKDLLAWYKESDNGGRYGVYHAAVATACGLITNDLSKVFTQWANAPSTDTPDFSSFDSVTAQLDAANNAVVAAANEVGVQLDMYHPDWQALKDGFTQVVRPTPMPTPRPTSAAPVVVVPSNPGSSSSGVVPPVRAEVPTLIPLPTATPQPTETPVPLPTATPAPALVDIPCTDQKGVYYAGGSVSPSFVTEQMSLKWLDHDTCRLRDVERNNTFVIIGGYCSDPTTCYVVVQMLDGPSYMSYLYVDGPFRYFHP